jgi:flagellar basal body-associated protein FliL
MTTENIIIIVVIVLIVLFVLGYFGRGRFRR